MPRGHGPNESSSDAGCIVVLLFIILLALWGCFSEKKAPGPKTQSIDIHDSRFDAPSKMEKLED